MQDRAEKSKNKARRAGLYVSGIHGQDRAVCENNTNGQATTSHVFRAVMEEPGNVVTSTIRNIPTFYGTKPEDYRERSSKTRVVLSMSNEDVFDVLNG